MGNILNGCHIPGNIHVHIYTHVFIICLPFYLVDITHWINFSYTTAMTSQWIIIHISHGFEGDIPECNIFELVFTICHKCNKYNCLPCKMLNHAWNSYIYHPPEKVMSSAGYSYVTKETVISPSRVYVLHTNKIGFEIQRHSKVNRGVEFQNEMRNSRSSVFHFIWL